MLLLQASLTLKGVTRQQLLVLQEVRTSFSKIYCMDLEKNQKQNKKNLYNPRAMFFTVPTTEYQLEVELYPLLKGFSNFPHGLHSSLSSNLFSEAVGIPAMSY